MSCKEFLKQNFALKNGGLLKFLGGGGGIARGGGGLGGGGGVLNPSMNYVLYLVYLFPFQHHALVFCTFLKISSIIFG